MSDVTVESLLTPIRERLDKATPGPWELLGGGEYITPIGVIVAPDDGGVTPADAVFIASAPSTITKLLAAVEAVTRVHEPMDALMNPGRYERVVKVCTGCGTDDGNWQRWPCPTVAAVRAALGDGE